MSRRLVVQIDTSKITDDDSFHTYFADLLGFPDFYGRNSNAWIDCVGDLDDPASGMTKVHVAKGGIVLFSIMNTRDFRERCPGLLSKILDMTSFLNGRDGVDALVERTVFAIATDD